MTEGRRTFGPVVGVGVAAAGLEAYAGAQEWVRVEQPDGPYAMPPMLETDGQMALALTLGLVLLACWGVVLVTRGIVRRLVAGLGMLVSLGLGAVVYAGWSQENTHATGWLWVAAVATLVAIVTTALAVAWSPDWPEMGSRYDAPGADRDEPPPEDRNSLDLWKSMDEGRDPTA